MLIFLRLGAESVLWGWWRRGEGPGANLRKPGPHILLEALDLQELSIASRWPGRVQIRKVWRGRPCQSGTGPCSESHWVACACWVPAVTSLKMHRPGRAGKLQAGAGGLSWGMETHPRLGVG